MRKQNTGIKHRRAKRLTFSSPSGAMETGASLTAQNHLVVIFFALGRWFASQHYLITVLALEDWTIPVNQYAGCRYEFLKMFQSCAQEINPCDSAHFAFAHTNLPVLYSLLNWELWFIMASDNVVEKEMRSGYITMEKPSTLVTNVLLITTILLVSAV